MLRQRRQKLLIVGGLLMALLIVLSVSAVQTGRAAINVPTVLRIIFGKVSGQTTLLQSIPPEQIAIVWSIRLPRILIAMLVGSGLAVSGAVFQALLMNPLAEPYTNGVSTGEAFGAAVAIYLNLFYAAVPLPITPVAFASAFLTLLIVMKIATRGGYLSSANLVIAGIIVSAILSAGITLLKSLSGEHVSGLIAWLMGNLSARTWSHVWLAGPCIGGGTLLCIWFAGDLNILSLGEREARTLGVDTQTIRRFYLIVAALMTAVCVSVSGIIGFVGLIVPHLLRLALTSDNRALIPLSALLGGVLLLLADTVARVLLNVEIPVGVITTLCGGPFFIYVFLAKNKSTSV